MRIGRHKHRTQGHVLALIVVLALMGHLWMQSTHHSARAEHDVPGPSVDAESASHHGHRGQSPPDDHAPLCSALPSGDHPATQNFPRCAPTFVAHPPPVVDQPLTTAGPQVDGHLRSPRSPEHGVVLVL